MKTFYIIWTLVAAPDPWSERQIMHSIYSTQEECTHQAVLEGATDRLMHQHWDWQCRLTRVWSSKRAAK